MLQQMRDRQFDGKRITRGGTRQRAQQWRLRSIEK
jgi:hypothetical protein